MDGCAKCEVSPKALLSKSGVAPGDVLFVDDAAENIRSVRLGRAESRVFRSWCDARGL